ncbi:MAG: anthranilate phosphoribosyltransferase [Deltaproteobacteria bacterium]|nr:anthranilate phosphoribosyltransferase [Deltaproteobacteria bacterium]
MSSLHESFDALIHGNLPIEEGKEILLKINERGVTANDLMALLQVLRAEQKSFSVSTSDYVDIVGTGGDGGRTFNISTTAALMAAGAGGRVLKHGNRAFSSQSGSADVLEKLGIRLDFTFEETLDAIQKKMPFIFLYAPLFLPILKSVSLLRKELKIFTIFNLVGPLLNPAKVQKALIGVSKKEYLDLYAEVICQDPHLLLNDVWIVHSEDGLDEISLTGKTYIQKVIQKKKLPLEVFDPQDYGFSYCTPEDLKGASPSENAILIQDILAGNEKGPKRNVGVLNAAALLSIDIKTEMQEAILHIQRSIDSKEVQACFEQIRIKN